MKDSGIIIVIFVMFVTTASQAGTRDLITQIELGQHEDNEKFWDYLSCVVKEFNQDLSRRNGTAENGLAALRQAADWCLAPGQSKANGHDNEDAQQPGHQVQRIAAKESKVLLELMCRDNESMTVITQSGNQSELKTVFYLTKVSPDFVFYLSLSNKTTISHLISETKYKISSYLIDTINSSLIEVSESNVIEIETLPKDFVPGSIRKANHSYSLNKFKKLDVDIVWDPVQDLVCLYDIVRFSMNKSEGVLHEQKKVPTENKFVRYLSHPLRNLSFNRHYQVWIYAVNERDRALEGPKYNFSIQTPTAAAYNLPDVHNQNGSDLDHSHLPIFPEEDNNWGAIISISLIVMFLLIVVVVALNAKPIVTYYNRRGRRIFHNHNDDTMELETFNTDLTIYMDNETELGLNNLKINNVIGQGAFGLVRKATILMNDGTEEMVAVKMLRKHANEEDLREFNHEIDVMKAVDKHPNIVGLVGHSKVINCRQQMMILMEYCSKGNLLNYLRDEWKRLTCMEDDGKGSRSDGGYVDNSVENPCYGACGTLSNRDLISMACQIAQGMDYLAVNKVVHRDLAARNILVCEGNIVKISDFGLSRDVYQYNMYKKKGSGKLPIKWLAIESLTHQVYTSQSDVWSYGILLYEILTLGSDPYPAIPTSEMLRLLNSGYRMERPKNCPPEIYEQMLNSWKVNPGERPSFKLMNEKFNEIATEMTDEMAKIQLESNSNGSDQEYPSYLKPI